MVRVLIGAVAATLALVNAEAARAQGEVTPVRRVSSAPLEPAPVTPIELVGSRLFVNTVAGRLAVRLQTPRPTVELAGPELRDAAPFEDGMTFRHRGWVWQTDGTLAGTRPSFDLRGAGVGPLVPFRGRLYARAGGQNDRVVRVDASGVRDIFEAEPEGPSLRPELRPLSDGLWFFGRVEARGTTRLYRVGADEDVRVMTTKVGPAPGVFEVESPAGTRVVHLRRDGVFAFEGEDEVPVREVDLPNQMHVTVGFGVLWGIGGGVLLSSDGTEAGTRTSDARRAPRAELTPVDRGHLAVWGDVPLRVAERATGMVDELDVVPVDLEAVAGVIIAAVQDPARDRTDVLRIDPATLQTRRLVSLAGRPDSPASLWPDPSGAARFWVLHHPASAPSVIRAFDVDGREVATPVSVTPRHFEVDDRTVVAALDSGHVLVAGRGAPLANRYEILDAPSRSSESVRLVDAFLSADGRAFFFRGLPGLPPMVRWSATDGVTRPLASVRFGDPVFVGVGIEGRPFVVQADPDECRGARPCFDHWQIDPQGGVYRVFRDIETRFRFGRDLTVASDRRGVRLVIETATSAEVLYWDDDAMRTRSVWSGSALPLPELVPGPEPEQPWLQDEYRLVRVDGRDTLPESDYELPSLIRPVEGAPSLISGTGPDPTRPVWQIVGDRVVRVSGLRAVDYGLEGSGGAFTSTGFLPDGGAYGPGVEVVLVTEGVARVVGDLWPGAIGSDPATPSVAEYGGTGVARLPDDMGVVFHAESPRHGRELWVSDGTSEGTRLVCDIGPGATPGVPADGTVAASRDGVFATALVPGLGAEVVRIPMAVVRGDVECEVPAADPDAPPEPLPRPDAGTPSEVPDVGSGDDRDAGSGNGDAGSASGAFSPASEGCGCRATEPDFRTVLPWGLLAAAALLIRRGRRRSRGR